MENGWLNSQVIKLFRARNFELRRCSKIGHALHLPSDNTELAKILSPYPTFIQCLRCQDFISTQLPSSQPVSTFPLIPTGSHGRRHSLIRLLAIERIARGVILFAVAGLTLKLSTSSNPVIAYLGRLSNNSKALASQLGVDSILHQVIIKLQLILHRSPSSYRWLAFFLTIYGLIELVEGLGLWFSKRWAEYLTVVATSLFVPLEIYEIFHHATITKISALIVNIIAIGYLLWKGRLFGLRGGHERLKEEEYQSTYLFRLLQNSATTSH